MMSRSSRVGRLGRLSRLAAVPAVADVLSTAARSATVRDLASHARRDPRGLAKRLANPTVALGLVRQARDNPSVRRLVRAGLLFMPLRYFAVAQAAIWSAQRVARRGRRRGDAQELAEAPTRP